MKQLYYRSCDYCKKQFTAKNKMAKYCSNGCRVMAWKIKHGIPIPQFKVQEIANRIPTKTEMLIREKTVRLKAIENQLKHIQSIENKYLEDKIDPLRKKLNEVLSISIRFLEPPIFSNTEQSKELESFYLNVGYYDKLKETKSSLTSFDRVIKDKEEREDILFKARQHLVQFYQNKIQSIIDETELYKESPGLIDESEKLTSEIFGLHQGFSIEQMQTTGKIIDTNQLLNMEFDLYKLADGFQNVFGHPEKGFIGMIQGLPGSGKSSFMVKFASYFHNNFGRVCYLPLEEGLSFTFKKKIEEYATYGNFDIIIETTPSKIQKLSENYDIVVVDSISHLEFNASDIEEITRYRKTTNTSFIFIVHENKDGSYKGSSSIAHLVDIQFKATAGNITAIKNRFRLNNLPEYNYKMFEIQNADEK